MSEKIRKFLLIISSILLVCFLAAVIPFIGVLFGADDTSAFAEDGPAAMDDSVVVDDPEDYSFSYTGSQYTAHLPYYIIVKIEDGDGKDVTDSGAVNAGDYTVTVKLADGYVFADGMTEKTYNLKIEQIALTWTYEDKINGNESSQELEPQFETEYAYQGTSQIDSVWAYGSEEYRHSKGNLTLKGGNVVDAGVYEFTVLDYYNYTNPTCKLTINPQEVNINNNIKLFWVLGDSERATEQPSSDEIYEYNYKKDGDTGVAFTFRPLDSAPFTSWSNWELKGSINAVHAVVSYREGYTNTITLNNSYDYYRIEYGGVRSASVSGKYVVFAKISAYSDNYKLVYDPEYARTDMEIEYNEDEDCYEIRKTWYIVHYFNSFIAESSADERKLVAYDEFVSNGGWTFGHFSESGATIPSLEHGDEIAMYNVAQTDEQRALRSQPGNYRLIVDGVTITVNDDMQVSYSGEDVSGWASGKEDVVVFTILSEGGIICENQPRSKFGYYVNDYMPVGKYTIIFTARSIIIGSSHRHWWNGIAGDSQCTTSYAGIEVSFEFEVYEATLQCYDSALNFYGNSYAAMLYANLSDIKSGYSAFFGVTGGKFTSPAITLPLAKSSGTYWGEDGVAEKYFDAAVYLTYRLKGDNGGQFYKASDGVWSSLISTTAPGTYYIYYRVNAKNYIGIPDATAFATKYFEVTVYEEIEIPGLNTTELRYTGSPQTVTPVTDDDRYVISDNTATDLGVYKAKFTLLDSELYRWKGIEGDVCEVEFSILKILNGWLPDELPAVLGWTSGSYDAKINRFHGTALNGVTVFSITYDEQGIIFAEGLKAFTVDGSREVSDEIAELLNALGAGNYYLWTEVAETAFYTAIARTSYRFTVESAEKNTTETILLIAVIVLGVFAGGLIVTVILMHLSKRNHGNDNGGNNGGGSGSADAQPEFGQTETIDLSEQPEQSHGEDKNGDD